MKYVTVDQIMRWKPCEDYPRSRVVKLFAGRKRISITTLEGMVGREIDASDAVWVVSHLLTDKQTRGIVRSHKAAKCFMKLYTRFTKEHKDGLVLTGLLYWWAVAGWNDREALRCAVDVLIRSKTRRCVR